VVREIFDEYTSAGRSIRAISRRLYEDGVTSPTGREVWASSMLSGMLRNRTYMGAAEWFRHETIAPPAPGRTHGRQTLRPKEDWIRVAVPTIITEEMFEAAQRVKRDNSIFSPRRTTPGAWLLRGLDRRRQLETQQTELTAQRHELAVGNRPRRPVTSFAKQATDEIDSLNFDQRQRLLRLIVEQVRVHDWQVELRAHGCHGAGPSSPRTTTPLADPHDRVFGTHRSRNAGISVMGSEPQVAGVMAQGATPHEASKATAFAPPASEMERRSSVGRSSKRRRSWPLNPACRRF
jgi:hypothetical protein